MTIFLDLDGTLIDVFPRYTTIHRIALQPHPVTLPLEEYWTEKRKQTPEPEILRHHYPEVDAPAYLAKRLALLEDPSLLEHDRLFPQTLDALETLKKKAKLILVTLRHDKDSLLTQLDRLELRPLLDHVLTKPGGTEPWNTKAEMIAPFAEEGDWFIGDTEADIQGGMIAGIRTCALTSGIRDEPYLAALEPDYLLDSIGDVPDVLFG